MQDKSNGQNKVLKIFPSIASANNYYNFREPFYTCMNGFVTYAEVGITSNPPLAGGPFPRFFEFGMTEGFDYGAKGGSMLFPYMVFEFVSGRTLTALGEEAAQNKSTSSYRLYKKGQVGSPEVKRQTQAMTYEIVHLLYMMKRIKKNGKEYGFYHADLNAGNVMVKDAAQNVTYNAGFGDIKLSNVPMVTFIDFGHSTSNLDDELGSKVNSLMTTFHKSIHIFSGSTGAFYKNLNGESLSKLSELAIGLSGSNSDIRLYQIMARALYDSGNYVNKKLMEHLKDCKTTTDCVKLAPPLFK